MDIGNATKAIAGYSEDLLLARASELATGGRLLEAEALLMRGNMHSAKRMDLLARIAAQTKRWEQAEQSWMEAQRLAPANEDFQKGIIAVREERKRETRRRRYLLWAMAGLVTILILGSGLAIAGKWWVTKANSKKAPVKMQAR
jgi:hypothetical protein